MTSPTTPFDMPDDEDVTATLTLHDAKGAVVTTAPGPVTWSASDNGSLVTLTPSQDGLSATLRTLETVTSGTYTLAVSTGTLGGSRVVNIVPGAPATADIDLHLTQHASAEEAAAVHGQAKRLKAGSHRSE